VDPQIQQQIDEKLKQAEQAGMCCIYLPCMFLEVREMPWQSDNPRSWHGIVWASRLVRALFCLHLSQAYLILFNSILEAPLL
jgi:hypothetical protein